MSDRQEIAKELIGLANVYRTELDKSALDMYLRYLEPHGIKKVRSAVDKIITSRKYLKFPLVADFLEYINPPENMKVRANDAWQALCEAVERYGYVATVYFEDPAIAATVNAMGGWIEYCNRTRDEEMHWLQKEFEERYPGYSKQPNLRNGYLIGWCDKENKTEPKRIEVVYCHYLPSNERAKLESKPQQLEAPSGEFERLFDSHNADAERYGG